MTQPKISCASRVCSTCKSRKKGCDKGLPICGYCSKRSLQCCYTSYPEDPAAAEVLPNLSTPAWAYQALAWNPNNLLSFERFNILRTDSSLRTALPYDSSYVVDSMALDEVLCGYVSYIFECLDLPMAKLYGHFFDGFHQWLPTISPEGFIERTTQLPNGILDAHDSILLLAICLIVLSPSLDSPAKSPEGIKNLYLAVKSCFAKTQAILTTTLPLLQAGILIAAYEYASRRPKIAYISIETCATMANVLGLGKNQQQEGEGQSDYGSNLKSLEERNVLWSIIVMERLVVAELTGETQLQTTKFPVNNFYLPTDLSYCLGRDTEAVSGPQCCAPLEVWENNYVSSFGRQAQAVYMLDQSLHILASTEATSIRLRAAEMLDEKLQAFLILIMREYSVPGRQCGANAIVIRTLFLLHQGVLDQLYDGAGEKTSMPKRNSSWAALDSAAKMMSDIASHHSEHVANIDILPICASYNAQIATNHIQAYQNYDNNSVRIALERLKRFSKAFKQRWPAHESLQ